MKTTFLYAAAGLLQSSLAAQIPPELSQYFTTDNNLIVTFSSGVKISEPGQLVPTADTKTIPSISLPEPISAQPPYVMLMVDADFNTTIPTNTVLHTISGNLTHPNSSPSLSHPLLLSAAQPTPLAPYIGPQPPKGKASHNYTLMVFAQPANFSVPANLSSFIPLDLSDVYTRTNFPVVEFVKEVGLGQPLAATYFRLDLSASNATTVGSNGTDGANSTVAAGSPSASATSATGAGGSGSGGSASGSGAAASQTAASGEAAGLRAGSVVLLGMVAAVMFLAV